MRTVGFDLLPGPAAAIRNIFELSIAGLGERAIAARLNAQRVPGLTGKGWHHSTVKHVLRSPGVIGVKQLGRMVEGKSVPEGEAMQAYYPPVVDESVFWRAQGARRGRKQRSGGRKGKTVSNLFSGLARCGECGAALLFVDKGNEVKTSSSVYLICTAAQRRFNCTNNVHHHYGPLEAEILAALTMFDVAALLDKPDTSAHRIADIEAEITEKSARLRRLAEFGDVDEVAGVMRGLAEEVNERRKQLLEHKRNAKVAEAEATRDAHAEYVALVEKMKAGALPDADLYVLRSRIAQYLRRLVESLVTDGKDLVLRLRAEFAPRAPPRERPRYHVSADLGLARHRRFPRRRPVHLL